MSGRGMSQKNLDLIEHCRRILAEVNPTTVRGVAYQLFTRGLIDNMGVKCVRNVSRMLVIARENGTIPWSWLVDETRNEEWSPSWNGLEDFGETLCGSTGRTSGSARILGSRFSAKKALSAALCGLS
jgi:hypothetical protein